MSVREGDTRLGRRDLGWVSLAWLSLGLVGCSRPWRVLRKSPGNPLLEARALSVRPLVFDAMRVGGQTELAYSSELDEEERKIWAVDKKAMNDAFLRGLREETSQASFDVVPEREVSPFYVEAHVRLIEPGYYAYVAAQPSRTRMVVSVSTPEGEPLDEIEVVHETKATISKASVSHRIRNDAERIGHIVGQYLRRRVTPDDA